MRIEIISGSPRKISNTVRIAKHLQGVLNEKENLEVGLIDMREVKLGAIEEVWSSLNKVPEEFIALAERMFNADGIILVSPEYNGGISPALKNWMDHFPKQERKVFGVVTGSEGALGGMRAAQQMIQYVAALFGILSPKLLITPNVSTKFSEEGALLDTSFQTGIDTFIKDYLWLLSTVKGK